MADARDAEQLRLPGGWLCLDFTNTRDGADTAAREEHLTSYDALLRWARPAGALPKTRAERLLRAGERRPEEARAVLRRAVALRRALYAVFTAAARGEITPAPDLALVNRELVAAMRHAILLPEAMGSGFRWEWPEGETEDTLESVLWPIVRSAAELLTAPELALVKVCPGTNCGWLFLDTSKNHRRQWCSMETCGNRAKARRHYTRVRTAPNTAEQSPEGSGAATPE